MTRRLILASATGLLLLGTVGCAQYPRPGYAQAYPYPPPPSSARRAVRQFDLGFAEGYRAGYQHRGGSGAPDWITARLRGEDRHEFRRGYHDGYNRGKWDRRHGVPPTY